MTDQTIPADKVRAWVTSWETTRPEHRTLEDAEGIIQALRALLPTPPLPTLADMTEEERKACQWMQSDVANHSVRYVLANPCDEDGEAALVAADGKIRWTSPGYVTPRPDLPRLTWPGDKKPAPALPDGWRLADHPEDGRVIVTNPTPDADGWACGVFASDMDGTGFDWNPYDPGELTLLDTPAPAPALPGGWRLADHPQYGRVIVTRPEPDLDEEVAIVVPEDDPIGNDWHLCRNDELTYLDNDQ